MKKVKMKTGSTQSALDRLIKPRLEKLNMKFNAISLARRKWILLVAGVMIAMLCVTLVFNSFYGVPAIPVSIDKITVPKDIYMQQTDTTILIPIGKMKGQIDGEFEAFYLAINKDGQVYINRDPEYGENRYEKSKGWKPITREQLAVYEKELHFISYQRKSLKP